MINRGIDKGIEAGRKVKEFMIDDTVKDIETILEMENKDKNKCVKCGKELTEHEKDQCMRNRIPPTCIACGLKKKKR